jgi:hypothetical protein
LPTLLSRTTEGAISPGLKALVQHSLGAPNPSPSLGHQSFTCFAESGGQKMKTLYSTWTLQTLKQGAWGLTHHGQQGVAETPLSGLRCLGCTKPVQHCCRPGLSPGPHLGTLQDPFPQRAQHTSGHPRFHKIHSKHPKPQHTWVHPLKSRTANIPQDIQHTLEHST